ncbi:MAG: phospholipid carrier-dependent glycosyltransferase [Parcubacteria group bacterium]
MNKFYVKIMNMRIDKRKLIISGLLMTSLIVHFLFFGYPREVVFDEVFFGKFIASYYNGEYFFDIHPPLGKLIIAGFGKLFDLQLHDNFSIVGNSYLNNNYLFLRFLPSLAGTFLPIILFLLAIEIGFSLWGATILGLFLIFENALLTQSRFILLDSFLLFFGFGSLLLYFIYRRKKNWKYLLGAGILGAGAFSIKWTGLTFIFLIIVNEIFSKNGLLKLKVLKIMIFLFFIPILFYFIFFVVHFSILSKTGTGDDYMTKKFQHSLEGNKWSAKEIPDINVFEKFIELNTEMYRANARLTQRHEYESRWYVWPLMIKPVSYWERDDRHIYFSGNLLLWWAGTAAVLWGLIKQLTNFFKKDRQLNFLLAGFFVSWLPFIFISRTMFLYHYLVSLIFSIVILVYFLDKSEKMKKIGITLVTIVFIIFLILSPFSYGFRMSDFLK